MDSKFIGSEWQEESLQSIDVKLVSITSVTWIMKLFNVWCLIQETITFYKFSGKVVATAFGILVTLAYPFVHILALIVMPKRTLALYSPYVLGLDLAVMLMILGHYLVTAWCGRRYGQETIPTSSCLNPMEVPFYLESSPCHDAPPKYDDVEAPPPEYDSLFPSPDTATTELATSAATLQNRVNLPSTRV